MPDKDFSLVVYQLFAHVGAWLEGFLAIFAFFWALLLYYCRIRILS